MTSLLTQKSHYPVPGGSPSLLKKCVDRSRNIIHFHARTGGVLGGVGGHFVLLPQVSLILPEECISVICDQIGFVDCFLRVALHRCTSHAALCSAAKAICRKPYKTSLRSVSGQPIW